jgi:putative ABC transport system permease protein
MPACLAIGGPTLPCLTILGIVADVRFLGFREDPPPTVFVPLQPQEAIGGVMLRVQGSSALALRDIAALAERTSGSDFLVTRSIKAERDAQSAPWRYGLAILFYLCSLGTVVAVLGTAAVVMSAVRNQIRDYAIRRALGASTPQMIRAVIDHVMLPSALGMAVGLGVAGVALERYFTVFDASLFTAQNVAVAFTAVAGSLIIGLSFPVFLALRAEPVRLLR